METNKQTHSADHRVWKGILACLALSVTAGIDLAADETTKPIPPAANRPVPVTVRVVTPDRAVLEARAGKNRKREVAASSGQRVFIDPDTKRIREATPEEARKMSEETRALFTQSTENLRPVRHANGMLSVDLQGGFQNAVIAQVGPDGKVTQTCVTKAGEAEALLNSPKQTVKRQAGKEAADVK